MDKKKTITNNKNNMKPDGKKGKKMGIFNAQDIPVTSNNSSHKDK